MLRVVDAAQVRELLTMPVCIAALEQAMRAVSSGAVDSPPRQWLGLAGGGEDRLGLMPGSSALLDVYGAKILSLHPGNAERGLPTIQGFVALFDRDTGSPAALIDGASLTAIRTAAASGLATRELAREDAATHGIFGTGVQAGTHVDAVAAVRDIRRVVVWGRNADGAREFARTHAERTDREIVACVDPRDAAACDIVSTVTAAREPVLRGQWLRPGAHVNLVGAHQPDAREADSGLVASARVYVDSMEAAMQEAGDLLLPLGEGSIDRKHILGEIGALLDGRIEGRRDTGEITLYKSLGVVAQDLFAADCVLRRAAES